MGARSSQASRLFFLISFLCLLSSGICKNVSIDDTDSSLRYAPPDAWTTSDKPLSLDFQNFHQLTDSNHPNANCTFQFNGTTLYMITPLWPYKVGALVSIDGTPGVRINMTDPDTPTQTSDGSETVGFHDVLVADNLSPGLHNVVISLFPGMDFLAIDGLKYTVQDDATSGNSTSDSGSKDGPSSSHSNVTPIVVGVVGGVIFLALVALVILLVRRRRQRTGFSPVNILGDTPPTSPGYQQRQLDPATRELEQASLHSPPVPVQAGGLLLNQSSLSDMSQPQSYGNVPAGNHGVRPPITMAYTDSTRGSSEFGAPQYFAALYSGASSSSSSSADPGSSSSRSGVSGQKFESAAAEKGRLKKAEEAQSEPSEYPDIPPPQYES